MKVEILHIDECQNWVEAGKRVRAALDSAGLGSVGIGFRLLATRDEAANAPFAGSPTILIDGSDAFPDGARTADLACRVYRTETGLAGIPSVEQIAEGIRRHR
ncbi:hypothetical protein [Luethyella okanaganae]|uniref:Thioredoxin family protein n=1 Tax=Luethyella okanaganae TaxID=69372 RepID=A0ABW1VDE1_9MICO